MRRCDNCCSIGICTPTCSVSPPHYALLLGPPGEEAGALYPQGLVRAFDANELAEKTMESLDADYWRKSEIPYTLSAMQEATLRVYLDALANRP